MKRIEWKNPNTWVSALGLSVLAGVFLLWLSLRGGIAPLPLLVSLLSVELFAWLCLRFVPGWLAFQRDGTLPVPRPEPEKEPGRMGLRLFLGFLAYDGLVLLLVILLRALFGQKTGAGFWLCTDSRHYLDIARDWYLSEGDRDRLVQLVFLPGYPLLVRLFHLIVPDYTAAGLLCSALCFAGCAPLGYRLLRLDLDHASALRALRYLCLLPGTFFFAMPMSESLFLLLSLACVYAARRDRWLAAGLFGALAAFTRSLGLVLLAPLVLEWAMGLRCRRLSRPWSKGLCLLLIPLGFGAYCLINYLVAGDPFRYMEYQRVHWHQNLGLFFSTAAYQTEYAVGTAKSGDLPALLGLWLPNLFCSLGALALMIPAAGKLRPSYTAWFLAYYLIAIGPTWLLSAPRYLLTLLPLPFALALLSRDRLWDLSLSLLLGDFSLFYLLAFSLRWQVW